MTGGNYLRTAAWYGDRPLHLAFPDNWMVTTQWPSTPPSASKIVIAACSEGVGHHELFPFVNGPRFQHQIHLARMAVTTPSVVPRKAARFLWIRLGKVLRLGGSIAVRVPGVPGPHANPIWLHVPGQSISALPAALPGMSARSSWEEILAQVSVEQGTRKPLSVAIYPCTPLQVLEPKGEDDH